MRNILALVGAVVVLFVGAGWYLDWYSISKQPSPDGATQRLQVDINSKKILKDGQQALERGSELLQDLQKGDGNKTSPAPASLPGPNLPSGNNASPMSVNNPLFPAASDPQVRRPFSGPPAALPNDPQYNAPRR